MSFGSLPGEVERHIRRKFGVYDANRFYVSTKVVFFVLMHHYQEVSLATGEVRDNFMGIPQEFAHTRLYADVDFTFYIDYRLHKSSEFLRGGLTILVVELKARME